MKKDDKEKVKMVKNKLRFILGKWTHEEITILILSIIFISIFTLSEIMRDLI